MSIGILGTRAGLVADVNLLLQVVLLIVLAIGALLTRMHRFTAHHNLMKAAVIVNAALIVLVMNPAFFRLLPLALRSDGPSQSTMLWPHALLGAVAELMGVYLIIRLKPDEAHPPLPAGIKWLMRLAFVLWVAALAVGIAFYFVWYT